jgi:L-ascorbate metabolism protein UlaG (beta-lactamase superfamily)
MMAQIIRNGCWSWFAGALALAASLVAPAASDAACIPIAERPARFIPASLRLAAVPPGSVSLTYLGHSSFVIETPAGITAVTDYNGYIKPPFLPTIATMNNAHSTHFTEFPEPGIKHVLRGWADQDGAAEHRLIEQDLRVHNVPTNIREWGGTRFHGNSIFVFETSGICVAHLGHLHHVLTDTHLARLGKVDVLLVPVDGMYTMGQFDMIEVIKQIKAPILIPMHFFSEARLSRFLERLQAEADYTIMRNTVPQLVVSHANLPSPRRPEVWVLPGH